MASLFEQVVACCGVSRIFAPRAVRRLCEKANIDPDHLTSGQLRELLPQLREMMLIYLSENETERHYRTLATLGADDEQTASRPEKPPVR